MITDNGAIFRYITRCMMFEIMDIERASFSLPWAEEEFIHALKDSRTIGRVIEIEDKIVGYIVYECYTDRHEILNVAVAPEFRRRGIGREMIDTLARVGRPTVRPLMAMNVCEANYLAQVWLRALGFRAVGVLRGHYQNQDNDLPRIYDAYRFERRHEMPATKKKTKPRS